ncbi:ATPase, V1 complex, subunit H [Halteromyces radiatus]|uniref:ATPase, V1 complex, subunit H n=1 Tax=Halteromyces radiatus TaxID=101107 RepID=UPI00221E731C|nr:ATPase, V1 complex, subunit H [Halteromyces radiatus]KAI8089241.1 ATPase, V1 complex, subunit H [Halteromyces radiatus]
MADNIPEVPLSLVSNQYLDKKVAQIRLKPILWEGYERANLLTHAQVELIKSIDKKSSQEIQVAVQGREDTYASLILYLLQSLSRTDTVQYVCVLADDILSGNEENARGFHTIANENKSYPYGPFFRILQLNDELACLEATKILTILASSSPCPEQNDLTELYSWLASQLTNANNNLVDIAVQELESLLRVRTYRVPFWKTPNAVNNLVALLDKSATPQMQYQVIFCLWLLTFEPSIAAEINEKYDIIPTLVDIAKGAIKEKVIRVAIATLRNLVEKAPSQNLAAMLVVKLLPFTENLSARKWSDADILEDVDYLKERLQENFQSLTTFEQYASEVETGKLEWSPPHKSEIFWKENAYKLEEHNFQLLRSLARILSTSTNCLILSVAASDIGHYIKFASRQGKRLLQEIGAKQRIMELMTHEDQDVRYQALSSVQKLMHQAWEF